MDLVCGSEVWVQGGPWTGYLDSFKCQLPSDSQLAVGGFFVTTLNVFNFDLFPVFKKKASNVYKKSIVF